MLMHSFVLDALDSTAEDTFSHFEMLIEEYRKLSREGAEQRSRLKILVPTVGTFHTPLLLRRAFAAYNSKYGLTTRRHVCISFNELRHILNLAQIMALSEFSSSCLTTESNIHDEMTSNENSRETERTGLQKLHESSPILSPLLSDITSVSASSSAAHPRFSSGSTEGFMGPSLITFDGDQTLYSDGANFESNPVLANYLYLLLTHGVTVAVVTAAGYEYQAEKYELRLSGLLRYFEENGLAAEDCDRFYLMGGECNYLLKLGSDFCLHPVKEWGPGGWLISTRHKNQTPGNWKDVDIQSLLNLAEDTMQESVEDQKLRARIIRKKRSVGLIPITESVIPREALDETVLRVQERLRNEEIPLPYCAFNGGRDCWVDVGNKSVGVNVLQSYLGLEPERTLHIGDQFLHTGNDFAARSVCPCVWITSPEETTYILKSILRLAGVRTDDHARKDSFSFLDMREGDDDKNNNKEKDCLLDFSESTRRSMVMDVYTGQMIEKSS